ncbi:MAG TPA: hypothetical protein VFY12_08535 [Arenimonas sp.]|nr:hypothetical protein [Arenimonas sp.]
MNRARYRLPDEPQPSSAAKLVVDPFWPLLATMLAGAWLGLPWLAINGYLLGSPTRLKEATLCAVAVAGALVIFFGITYAAEVGWLGEGGARYALLAIIAWKLVCVYGAVILQTRALELYEYFGGAKSNGVIALLLGMLGLRQIVLGSLSGSTPLLVALG